MLSFIVSYDVVTTLQNGEKIILTPIKAERRGIL